MMHSIIYKSTHFVYKPCSLTMSTQGGTRFCWLPSSQAKCAFPRDKTWKLIFI